MVLKVEVSLTGKDWQKHPIVTGPDAPCILDIDYLRNRYFKDPKKHQWAFGIAAVNTEGIKKLNILPGLAEHPSVVGFLKHQSVGQFAFTWRSVQYTWNQLPQGWKHGPTICHGLIQAALEKGEAPEHLQYMDDIVWGNTAAEIFEKGVKIIQILLEDGFAIKKSTVEGSA
ncbi:hypothetical protein HGM15179_018568 [Zosterops borbonicus]|uniref:ribonuclease H n=1 Tax=Zosterops borbonicus TaxID=364589 RepID=A0A8K1FVX5_9PASS|nr:hypothetical protein HGM15179_018568 [Zosterops borbonicus]